MNRHGSDKRDVCHNALQTSLIREHESGEEFRALLIAKSRNRVLPRTRQIELVIYLPLLPRTRQIGLVMHHRCEASYGAWCPSLICRVQSYKKSSFESPLFMKNLSNSNRFFDISQTVCSRPAGRRWHTAEAARVPAFAASCLAGNMVRHSVVWQDVRGWRYLKISFMRWYLFSSVGL